MLKDLEHHGCIKCSIFKGQVGSGSDEKVSMWDVGSRDCYCLFTRIDSDDVASVSH